MNTHVLETLLSLLLENKMADFKVVNNYCFVA